MTRLSAIIFAAIILLAGLASAQNQPVASNPTAVASAAQTAAQSNSGVPRLVKFGGLLKDAAGNLLTDTVGITFAVYSEQSGGVPLWQETQNVQFSQGRYTVYLGASTSGGIPAELFASGQSRWLGTRILSPGEEESSRVFLTSVPYALKAVDADTIGGLPPSAFARANPTQPAVSTDLANPAYPGALAVRSSQSTPVTTQGGTANTVAMFSSPNMIANSEISESPTSITLNLPVNLPVPSNGQLATSGALTAASVNGVLSAASFGPPGADLGTQVNDAIAACTGTCEIDLPPSASLSYKNTINVTSPGISIRGAGSQGTHLMFTGSGDAILIEYPAFTISEGGTFSNFQIDGGGTENQTSCIHVVSVNQIAFYNVTCKNFTGSTGNLGTGFWLDNQAITPPPPAPQKPVKGWSERITCVNCYSYANFKGWRFTVNGGMNSFARFHCIACYVNIGLSNGIGMSAENGANVYDSWIDLAGNDGSLANNLTGTALFQVDSTSAFGTGTEFHVHFENQNSTAASCVTIAANGSIMGQGWINCSESSGPILNAINPNGHFMLMGSQDPSQTEFNNNGVGPWLFGETVNGNSGLGLNMRWDGSNWQCNGDGGNNGCALISTNSYDGEIGFYSIPTSGGSNQTVSQITLNNNKVAAMTAAGGFSTAGNVIVGGGANVVYRCSGGGGSLPTGALTTVSTDCGTAVDTGLRTK